MYLTLVSNRVQCCQDMNWQPAPPFLPLQEQKVTMQCRAVAVCKAGPFWQMCGVFLVQNERWSKPCLVGLDRGLQLEFLALRRNSKKFGLHRGLHDPVILGIKISWFHVFSICFFVSLANLKFNGYPVPLCSMYGIFTYICHRFGWDVGKYSIRGASGLYLSLKVLKPPRGDKHIKHIT